MDDLQRSLAKEKISQKFRLDLERRRLERLRKAAAEKALAELLALVPDEQPTDRGPTVAGLSPLVVRLAARTASASRQTAARASASLQRVVEVGFVALVSSLFRPPEDRKVFLQSIIDETTAQLAGVEPSLDRLADAAIRSLGSALAMNMFERGSE